MAEPGRFQLFLLLLLIVAVSQCSSRPILINRQLGYSKTLATQLGLTCTCCDGEKGKCTSTWEGSCSKLHCRPWKFRG